MLDDKRARGPSGKEGPHELTAGEQCNGWILAHPERAQQPAALASAALAVFLGVSRRHVETMHALGHLPMPVRLGRRRVWVRSEIEAWLAAGAPNRVRWHARKAGAR